MAEINGTPGNDSLTGTSGADSISGGGGDDTINDNGGFDTISGGTGADQLKLSAGGLLFGDSGDDTLTGGIEESTNFLDGGPGNDRIDGGTLPFFAFLTYATATSGVHVDLGLAGPQDIGGGQGMDTLIRISQAIGSTFNDTLTGGTGRDIIYGGDGDDSLAGGAGDDQLIGGTGNDVIFGDGGVDFISGDRGADTETGGAGADLFHGSQDAGIDKVLDFHLSEGDRVFLDPGTIFTVSQVGADTVIDMGAGNQMILVGVQMSTLTPGWIFGA